MSTTTTYGYKKPQAGDRGQVWCTDLEFNIDRLDAHNHDGINGPKIAPSALSKSTQDILAANWGADSGGSTFSQTISMPTGYTFADSLLRFYINGGTDDGHYIYPTVVRASVNSFTVTVNDNTLALKVTYG